MTIADKLITIADNTPVVAETVNASKVSVSGSTVRVDNVLNTGHALNITAAGETNVFVYGKNLLETETVTAVADNNKVLFSGSIKGNFVFSCEFHYEDCKAPNAAQFQIVYQDDSGSSKTASLTYGNVVNRSISFSGTLTKITYVNWGQAQNGTVDKMMLEVGTSASDFEKYSGVQIGSTDDSGKVVGLKSISPTMTIIGDQVECEYFPTSAEPVYEKYQQLKAAQVALAESIKEG